MTMTKEQAMEIINTNGKNTNWFNNSICEAEMIDMFRNEFMFGASETAVIMAALKLAGAKFRNSFKVYCYLADWEDDSCWGFVGANDEDEAEIFVYNTYYEDEPDDIIIFENDDLTEDIILYYGQVDQAGC